MKTFDFPKGVKIKIDRFNKKAKSDQKSEKFTYIKIHNKYYNNQKLNNLLKQLIKFSIRILIF